MNLPKKLKLLIFICLQVLLVNAQGSLDLTLNLVDGKGQKLPNAAIVLKENSLGLSVNLTTDGNGSAHTLLSQGKVWVLHINGYNTKTTFEVPERGAGKSTHTESYLPEFFKRLSLQTYNRSGLTEEKQNLGPEASPTEGKAMMVLKVKNLSGKMLPGIYVAIYSGKEKKLYTSKTDKYGFARLIVTPGLPLDIDVGNNLNNDYCDVVSRAGAIITKTLTYQPPTFKETRYGDTVIQVISAAEKPASGYSLYSITVLKGGATAASENIYLREVYGNEVYKGTTDNEGEVRFQLPQGRMYMIHFDYQKDVDVVNLSTAFGESQGTKTITYIPDPRLEHPELFIPWPDRLIQKDFQQFVTKQYPDPKKNVGLYLNWSNSVNAQSKEAVLEIGVKAGSAGAAQQLPMNISFVLDRSGSMAGYYRIESLKTAMKKIVSQLPPDSKISVIMYDDNDEVLVNHGIMPTNRNSIVAKLDAIQPGGGTNMLEALKKAYKFVNTSYSPNAVNRVIVLTDGYDNNPVESLTAVQKMYNDKIECSAFGIGDGYNAALLELLVTNGKGRLYSVPESKEFTEQLSDFILNNIKPSAINVTVEVEYNQKIVFMHLLGYDPQKPVNNPVTYKLPNLYEGNQSVALAKFDLVAPDASIEKQPVIVRVKYTNPLTMKTEVVQEKAYLKWNPYTGEVEMFAEAYMKKLYAVAALNRGLKLMSEAYAGGNNQEAEKILNQTKEEIKRLYPKSEDSDVDELMSNVNGYLSAFAELAKIKNKK